METQDLVVLGSGHAGSELALAARQGGWPDRILLIGDEPELPYHRPPLSKAYMLGTTGREDIRLRPESAYEAAKITRWSGVRVDSIDRASHQLSLSDGRQLRYAKLALCTGGRPRQLACEGLDPAQPPSNLLYLKTVADADRIRAHLQPGGRMVVVGGGYVGLEVAASASALGMQVSVLEAQPRVLARVAGAALSAFYEALHRSKGVSIHTSTQVQRIDCSHGKVQAVLCQNGLRLEADLLVVGIGMVANIELAVAAGLAQGSAITVDEHGCTADPDIMAAGDCTQYEHAVYGRMVRIESVPNALEQARAAAGWLCGKPKPNRSVPWFWSDQYDLKLQMVGLSQGYDQCVLRGNPDSRSFCAFYLEGQRLLAVDAVNRPADFMLARRAMAQPVRLDGARLTDESVPLKDLFSAGVS